MPLNARVLAILALAIAACASGLATEGGEAEARLPDEQSRAQPAAADTGTKNQYDWNLDGCNDLIARKPGDSLMIYHGTCTQSVLTQFESSGFPMKNLEAVPWDNWTSMVLPGDISGDTCPDILGTVNNDGNLYLAEGNCAADFKGTVVYIVVNAGHNWDTMDWLLAPTTFDDNLCGDLLEREIGSQGLNLFSLNCSYPYSGGFPLPVQIDSDMSEYNWLLSPSFWDTNDTNTTGVVYCADVIGRRASDASLQFQDGTCANSIGAPTQIGNGWGAFTWLFSGADWDNGFTFCPDIVGRTPAGDLLSYHGNCGGAFAGQPDSLAPGIDWNQFDYIVGDSGPVMNAGQTPSPSPSGSPTVTSSPTPQGQTPTPTPTATPVGQTPSPTAPGQSPSPTPAGQTPTPTATPTHTTAPTSPGQTPDPSATPRERTWGDANCSGAADPIDSLVTLRFDAGLSTNTGDCPLMGQLVDVHNASPHLWGDIDCSNQLPDPVDSLKLLRFDAGLSVSQGPGCPGLGTDVIVSG